MPIRKRMKTDLLTAMRAQQKDKVSALRTLIAAIDNAEAVPLSATALLEAGTFNNGRSNDVPRKILTVDDIQLILQRELENRKENVIAYQRLGKEAEALLLQNEIALIEQYQKENRL